MLTREVSTFAECPFKDKYEGYCGLKRGGEDDMCPSFVYFGGIPASDNCPLVEHQEITIKVKYDE